MDQWTQLRRAARTARTPVCDEHAYPICGRPPLEDRASDNRLGDGLQQVKYVLVTQEFVPTSRVAGAVDADDEADD